MIWRIDEKCFMDWSQSKQNDTSGLIHVMRKIQFFSELNNSLYTDKL